MLSHAGVMLRAPAHPAAHLVAAPESEDKSNMLI